jgi:putative ABC transport system permease protein
MEFSEILKIALTAIKANKLRSVLTLLGIAVGVFSIIAVMTAVQVLQNSIESGLSQLGSHTFQIQKMPITFNHDKMMKAMKRKDITQDQVERLKERMTLAGLFASEAWTGAQTVQYGSMKTNPSVEIGGEEPIGVTANNWVIREGRSLSENDLQHSTYNVILGDDVARKIFPHGNAVSSIVRIGSNRYTVIGVFEAKGGSLGGNSDNFAIVPLSTFLQEYGKNRSLNIMIEAKSAETYDDCMEEARNILRTIRKVAPGEEDDFTLFSNDSLIATFNEFTLYVKLGVGFISFISLLAAGIGIMNIMLVSVTERTREIGIRKAIGARRMNILGQFIAEAVVLCQIGGMIGILLGIMGGNLAALLLHMDAVFPLDWALIGFAITTFVGVVFGVYPAWKASNLDPIEALRFE